jgi:hypothetical protein
MHVCQARFAFRDAPQLLYYARRAWSTHLYEANREKSAVDKAMEFVGVKNFEHETKNR